MVHEISNIIFSHWWKTSLVAFLFFLLLYFTSSMAALILQRFFRLPSISNYKDYHKQIKTEIRLSLISIGVFSLEAIPIQIAFTNGLININLDINLYTLVPEMILLFLWNEIHFYVTHRLLHTKWLFNKVHFRHHKSNEPTVFSTYSFHWLEAALLGSVIYVPVLLFHFQFLALLSLPIMSIILNTLGHWHHDIAPDKPYNHWLRFSYRHSMHHKYVKGNYGFFLVYIDQLFKTNLKNGK
ncbi:sterol desaturase family protein [Fulvivirgaceae bacterium BMA10]|uniref:Sterol desaturase family protein n=1 Tax=Splendidivirga corallicola TaxID=3051826 RepID=A0ABT8KSU8_9BACT|nr:sterol desaturase family protein [Fulvivirgaceae bacterium BMA10]